VGDTIRRRVRQLLEVVRARDLNRRLVLVLHTACFSRVTFPSIVVPVTKRDCWRKRDRDQTRVRIPFGIRTRVIPRGSCWSPPAIRF
jgi:hypothetical protein